MWSQKIARASRAIIYSVPPTFSIFLHLCFTIEILREPENFPEEEDFYKIEFKLGMKPIKVEHIEECEQEMIGEEISSAVIQQNLLPGGRNENLLSMSTPRRSTGA